MEIIKIWFSEITFSHLRNGSSFTNFLTFSCVFHTISLSSIKKTLWESLFMKIYKNFRKPSELILACMRRSKHVQIAWILMILINLTHFFVYLLEVFFKNPLHYQSLFEKWKNETNVHIDSLTVKLTDLLDFRENLPWI